MSSFRGDSVYNSVEVLQCQFKMFSILFTSIRVGFCTEEIKSET